MKPAVLQLGDGTVLGPSALQTAILGLQLPYRVGLDVPANTRPETPAIIVTNERTNERTKDN